MEDHRDSTSTPKGSDKNKGKAVELETGGNGGGGGGGGANLKQPKTEKAKDITDAVHVSWRLPIATELKDPRDSTSTPEGSDKNKGKAVEPETGGNGSDGGADLKQPPKVEESDKVITDAVPLTWRLRTASGKYLNYLDGKYHFGLPFGWLVEPRPRTSTKYIGKIDQYFYEPGTGRQFRSLKAVKRYLETIGQQPKGQGNYEQETKKIDEHTPILTHGNQPNLQATMQKDGHTPEGDQPKSSQRKKVGRKRSQAPSFVFEPSKKVLWALADDAETEQSVGENVVP